MKRVGIIGASGYTGVELARILTGHSGVELTVATSRQYAGQPLSQVYPSLAGRVDVVCEYTPVEKLAAKADLFFTAVPHQTAMNVVPQLLEAGKKVVDLSADFRIADASVYEKWYQAHTAPDLLGEAIYGLPEINRQSIAKARLVANPGCYPTSVILAVAPLLRKGLLDLTTLVVDSKSGTSGAGRSAQTGSLFCEVNEGFKAYKVGEHRHTPEIEQELGRAAGQPVTISFTPHLLPISRGILSTIYGSLAKPLSREEAHTILAEAYSEELFVRVMPLGSYPAVQWVRGSNFCDIGLQVDSRTGRVILVSVIDNLVKGAAGQAVQNMNLMLGFPEDEGLRALPVFP